VNGIAAVFWRDYRQRMTNLSFVFWDLFVPLAYLALFGLGFERLLGGAVTQGGVAFGYTEYLLPGVLAMVSFTVALNTAWGFFMDKDSGIFFELLTYPITRPQLLVGKIGFNVLLALLGSMLAMALGVLAMDARVRWELLPATLGAVALGTSGWFFLFSTFAITSRRMDSFNTLTSAAYILLMFLSTMFYPAELLPDWFRAVARCNPMTWQVDLLRYGVLGVGEPGVLLLEAAALAAFVVAGLACAVRALNRVD
jgi:ABC-type multidrug transport system permease subunit